MNKRQKLIHEQFINDEQEIIRRLKSIYTRSLKDIDKKTEILQGRIDELATRLATIKNDETRERVQSMQQAKIYQKQYQDALRKQVSGILDNMQSEEFQTVSDYLEKCYENGFIGTMYDMAGQGIPLCFPIDQSAMVRAVQTDSKINEGLYKRLGVDVDELKKQITAQISRGISSGMTTEEIATQISLRAKVGINNAIRIARTEGHRIRVQSTMDACEKAKEKGADVVKQWDATLDGDTRPAHQSVDGEIRELNEPFSNGLMYPGDPNGSAGEVVNCRCALLQRARWALNESELETLKKRAEYFGLDKSETFDDFKNKYLKAAKETEQMQQTIQQEKVRQRREEWKRKQMAKQNKPNFDSMDRKQLVTWASENLVTEFDDVTGANVDYIRSAVSVINDFETKMGGKTIEGMRVKFGGTPNGVYAKYDDKTHTILLKKTGSIKTFEESQKKENERAKWKIGKNYHATETFTGTIWHELGHAIDIDVGQSLSRALSANSDIDSKSVRISVYAGSMQNVRVTRRSEAWAENFAAYMDGGANAKDVPIEITQMIENYFRNKKK